MLNRKKYQKEYYSKNKERLLARSKKNLKIYRRKRKQRCVDYLGGFCADCGGVYPAPVYDFHHDTNKKDFEISQILAGSWDRIKKELDRCVLLCANCHRLRHSYRERY